MVRTVGLAVASSDDDENRPALGERLRAFRRARRLTLRQVSEVAGVTEGFLSQVERGTSNASITTLRAIAETLGLTLADLFDAENDSGHRVLRAHERASIEADGVIKYMLTRRPLRNLEVVDGEFEVGASTGGPDGHAHGDSQELLVVIAGTGVVTLGSAQYTLHAGDSLEYQSSTSPGVPNVGRSKARFLFIISPPSL